MTQDRSHRLTDVTHGANKLAIDRYHDPSGITGKDGDLLIG